MSSERDATRHPERDLHLVFYTLHKSMTTKDILNQMEKEFDELTYEEALSSTKTFTMPLQLKDEEEKAIKSFIHSYTRTLLESFGEEIMSASIGAIPTSDDYAKGWNDSRQENYKVKSLKVKEIISQISK